ncbi:hypothetical protein P4V41_07755 [Fictibacillus nanhaiensis]|uniref:hypothetical protein n=1 Tax=Fictibacillus nanhaiensis TaxID=742169 RepID=UPI002E1B4B2B|nr:hypothetical protein [Fictibacillus nanhaiensis]
MKEHESKKECIKNLLIIGKILYWTGALKLIPNNSTYCNKKRFGTRFRAFHPLSWLMILLTLVLNGFNKENFKDIKKEIVKW